MLPLLMVALIGTVDLTSAKCHTFFGFSTCDGTSEVDLKYSFAVEWWVVNVNHRTAEIRRCVKIARTSPVWVIVESIPYVNEMLAAAFQGTVFERLFEQATKYYADREYPVDLLLAPELTYTEIYLSFKGHQDEIFAALDPIIKEKAFDDDVVAFLRQYRKVIERGALVMTMIPTYIFDPYLNIFDDLSQNPNVEDPTLPPLSDGAMSIIDTLKNTAQLTSG